MKQRYQEEIESILAMVEEGLPATPHTARPARRRFWRPLRNIPSLRRAIAVSAMLMLVTGVALLVVSLALNALAIRLSVPAGWAGVGLVALTYVCFFASSRPARAWKPSRRPFSHGGSERGRRHWWRRAIRR